MSFNFSSLRQKPYYEEPRQSASNQQESAAQPISRSAQQRTKLTKKSMLNGFQLTDLVWIRPAEGRFKYQVLVRYIDPEAPKTKRFDGSYQKIIKFGQKGLEDYVDPPHNVHLKDRNCMKIRSNRDNPLHANFYYINLLNGSQRDIYQNFNFLKKQIFS